MCCGENYLESNECVIPSEHCARGKIECKTLVVLALVFGTQKYS